MPYLKVLEEDLPIETAINRVRSKAYHDMRNYCVNTLGYEKDKAKEFASKAANYHLQRWKVVVGLEDEEDEEDE